MNKMIIRLAWVNKMRELEATNDMYNEWVTVFKVWEELKAYGISEEKRINSHVDENGCFKKQP